MKALPWVQRRSICERVRRWEQSGVCVNEWKGGEDWHGLVVQGPRKGVIWSKCLGVPDRQGDVQMRGAELGGEGRHRRKGTWLLEKVYDHPATTAGHEPTAPFPTTGRATVHPPQPDDAPPPSKPKQMPSFGNKLPSPWARWGWDPNKMKVDVKTTQPLKSRK